MVVMTGPDRGTKPVAKRKLRRWLAPACLALFWGAPAIAGDGDGGPTSAAPAPQVAARYQRTLDRAWAKALAGESPAAACAGLKGRLVGTGTAVGVAERDTLFACNVLLPVRFYETLLDRVAAGESTCAELVTPFRTQMRSMTLSIEGIQAMVDAIEADPERGAATGLRLAVDDATLIEGLEDPQALIKERLSERVRKTCPELAGILLG
jgi:hypothetical protein